MISQVCICMYKKVSVTETNRERLQSLTLVLEIYFCKLA